MAGKVSINASKSAPVLQKKSCLMFFATLLFNGINDSSLFVKNDFYFISFFERVLFLSIVVGSRIFCNIFTKVKDTLKQSLLVYQIDTFKRFLYRNPFVRFF